MKILIFFILFIAVFILQTLIIKRFFIDKSSFGQTTKKAMNWGLLTLLTLVLLYPFERYFPYFPDILFLFSSIAIGFIFIPFSVVLVYALIHKIFSFGQFSQNRREFFTTTLDYGALMAMGGASAFAMNEARNVQIQTQEIQIKNLHNTYKIAQLSDIHIGGLIDKEFIASLVAKTNALSPDLVVITGDLVDTKLESAKEALQELQNLQSKYGTFFIVGNHEYFHGVAPIIAYVKSLGITVLENENVYIGEAQKGFYLCGVYDYFGYRYGSYVPDIAKALQNTSGSPVVLLAHQPRFINELSSTQGIDLILCGHTHGGQIFPFNFLVGLQQPYVKGHYIHNQTTQVYVNKGSGFWGPPMRLGASSEITLLHLYNSKE